MVSGAGRRGKLEDEELPATGNFAEPMANDRLRRGVVRLQRRELERRCALKACGGEEGVEPLGQGLHLRQLGHAPTLSEARYGRFGQRALSYVAPHTAVRGDKVCGWDVPHRPAD